MLQKKLVQKDVLLATLGKGLDEQQKQRIINYGTQARPPRP